MRFLIDNGCWHGRAIRLLLTFGLTCLTAGCASPWWNAFLDPSQSGGFRENSVLEIQRTISFRDKPSGISGATDPTPDDLIADVETYKLGPGDAVEIVLLDFLARDSESRFTPAVDELGHINISQLGWIYVEGMAVQDLQQELVQRSKDAGIYREDKDPTVTVSLLSQQQRLYLIDGAVAVPATYSIPYARPDFRLREAILQAGGLSRGVKTVYVHRNAVRKKRVDERAVP